MDRLFKYVSLLHHMRRTGSLGGIAESGERTTGSGQELMHQEKDQHGP